MDKNGEIKKEITPCCICGHPSEDGMYCACCQRKPKTAESLDIRTLPEGFILEQERH